MKKLTKLLLVFPIALALAGCTDNNPEASQAQELGTTFSQSSVTIHQNEIDLGDVPILGGKVDIYFSFQNTGKQPIVLLEGTTSCGCTEAVIKSSNGTLSPRIRMTGHGALAKIKQVLEPGERAELTATFDPMAHGPNATGPVMRTVFLKTNSVITPRLEFTFLANVVK